MPSSVIRRFAWHGAPPRLGVEFVTGRVYRYAGVPEALVEEMRAASSHGGFFNRRIRDRFPCERLRGGWPDDPPDAPALAPA